MEALGVVLIVAALIGLWFMGRLLEPRTKLPCPKCGTDFCEHCTHGVGDK